MAGLSSWEELSSRGSISSQVRSVSEMMDSSITVESMGIEEENDKFGRIKSKPFKVGSHYKERVRTLDEKVFQRRPVRRQRQRLPNEVFTVYDNPVFHDSSENIREGPAEIQTEDENRSDITRNCDQENRRKIVPNFGSDSSFSRVGNEENWLSRNFKNYNEKVLVGFDEPVQEQFKTRKHWFDSYLISHWIYSILVVSICLAMDVAMMISPSIPVNHYLWFSVGVIGLGIIFIFVFYINWLWNVCSSSEPDPTIPEINIRPVRALKPRNTDVKKWPVVVENYLLIIVTWIGLFAVVNTISYFVLSLTAACFSMSLTVLYILTSIFILLELPLLSRNNKMTQFKNPTIALFGMAHVFATNVCIALHFIIFGTELFIRIRTFVAFNGYCKNCQDYIYYFFFKEPMLRTCEFKMSLVQELYYLLLYVQPHLIGFCCLVCIALIFKWKNFSSGYFYLDRQPMTLVLTRRQKWLIGIISALVILITVSVIGLFFWFATKSSSSFFAFDIYRSLEIFYNVAICLLIFALSIKFTDFAIDLSMDISLPSVVLILNVIGLCLYDIFYLIGYFQTPFTFNSIINEVKCFLNIFTACTQVVVFHSLLRRFMLISMDASGKFLLYFLLILNICQYLSSCIENHVNEYTNVGTQVYGKLGWTLIQNITVPCIITFRLFCVVLYKVVLSTCW